MFSKNYFLLVILFISLHAFADIDVENNNSEAFKISGYVDAYYADWGEYNTIPSREFNIRRAGFEFDTDLTETISTALKVETRPTEVFLKNAYICWNPTSRISARLGQFKKETLLAGSISTWKLEMFDRPQIYSFCEDLTFTGRDLGADLNIELPKFYGLKASGTAGIFNGNERADDREDNELLYSLRGQIDIPSIDLTLGASAVAHRVGIENPAVVSGYSLSARQIALSADASFDYNLSNWYKINLTGEYTSGENWGLVDVIAGEAAPKYRSYWGIISFIYRPLNIPSISAISISISKDRLVANTQTDFYSEETSVVASVYPTDDFRVRFGFVSKDINLFTLVTDYTNYIAEVGIRF